MSLTKEQSDMVRDCWARDLSIARTQYFLKSYGHDNVTDEQIIQDRLRIQADYERWCDEVQYL